jgi:metal transporter CNNM
MSIDPLISLSLFTLIAFSGLFSGLTLGLYSLDKTELQRKTDTGNKQAARVLKVRNRGNLLLVSLLLGNVAVNSAISLILGGLAGGIMAGILATGLIVIFGEIIPQATCARYALAIGSRTAWIVEVVIVVLYPIGKPIAWALDKTLGEELKTIWSKRELEHIIRMHEDDPRSAVDEDEERILLGALSFSDKTAVEVMTERKDVYALQKTSVLDQTLLHEIRESGLTRIPVYSKDINDIVGLLYAKDLIGIDPDDGTRLEKMMRTAGVVRVSENRKLDSLLNTMIVRRAHMALVTKKKGTFVGIVTMEDVVEEIIGREILDEDDEV